MWRALLGKNSVSCQLYLIYVGKKRTLLCCKLRIKMWWLSLKKKERSNSHFYDGSFDLQHSLSDLLPDPLLPGKWSLVLITSSLLARVLFGFHFYSKNKKKEQRQVNKYAAWIVVHVQRLREKYDIWFCGRLPSDSVEASVFLRQKMEVVEACSGRNFSRRGGLSLLLIFSPVIFFLSTFLFIFLKKSGISTSLLSHSPWHCVETKENLDGLTLW